jgi:hypothetical protein
MRLEQKPMTQTPTSVPVGAVTGQFVELDGIDMYQIRNFDEMPPFLMSIVSDSDHWMYAQHAEDWPPGASSQSEASSLMRRTTGCTGPMD